MSVTVLATRQIPTSSGTGITRVILNITTATTGLSAVNTDYVYLCSGTFTITLPTAVGNTNRYTLKNIGMGVVTGAFTSGQTGDGNTIIQLTQNQAVDFISNNANYFII